MFPLNAGPGDVFLSPPAGITIENSVGLGQGPVWYEADEPPGPEVIEGESVWYRLVVTNTGSITASNIVLTHSRYPILSCEAPADLAPGASFECVLDAQVAVLGQQEALAGVTAHCGTGTCQDSNYAYYTGRPSFIPTVLSISPTVVALRPGESVTFRAVAQDAAGNVMDVTAQTLFAIDPQAGGSWNGNVYTGGALGTWTVSAQYDGLGVSMTLRTVYCKVYVPLICRNE